MANRYDYTVLIGGVDVTALINKMGGPEVAQRYMAGKKTLMDVPEPEPTPELVPEPAPEVPTEFSLSLDGPPRLPFGGAVLEVHRGSGVVKIERKLDGIYVGGKKLGLFLSEGQKDGKVIKGHNLRKEVEARGNNLSAVLLDFFVEHPEFWPEEWKTDSQGKTLYVFFWDDIFRNPSRDGLCVRCGYWKQGEVVSHYNWLGLGWDGNNPAGSAS